MNLSQSWNGPCFNDKVSISQDPDFALFIKKSYFRKTALFKKFKSLRNKDIRAKSKTNLLWIFFIILIFFRLVDQLLIFVVEVVREIIVVESVAAFKLYYLKSFLFMFFFLGDWKHLDHFLWLLVL